MVSDFIGKILSKSPNLVDTIRWVMLSHLRQLVRAWKIKRYSLDEPASPEWQLLQELLNTAKRIIDLGCGANPHPRAYVGVDAFLEPAHRRLGQGPRLDAKLFRQKGVHFVQADITYLPFRDKWFDFAYAHHVFEHLPDPKKACAEMMRIAKAGAIITPSIFAEIAFGRPYHLWFVIARGNTLLFIRKTKREDCPFGEHPIIDKNRYRVTPQTNPFDILLNDGSWYRGFERMPRLSRLLRKYWYSHSPVIEVVFIWENKFNCVVVHEDGEVDVG
jgi:SAM-dependent methyltransferase